MEIFSEYDPNLHKVSPHTKFPFVATPYPTILQATIYCLHNYGLNVVHQMYWLQCIVFCDRNPIGFCLFISYSFHHYYTTQSFLLLGHRTELINPFLPEFSCRKLLYLFLIMFSNLSLHLISWPITLQRTFFLLLTLWVSTDFNTAILTE